MFNTIFKKQLVIYIGNLLGIFLILGFVLSGMVRSYFYQQKKDTLTIQSDRIASGYISSNVAYRSPFDFFNTSLIDHITVLHNYFNASSFVCVFNTEQDNEELFLSIYAISPNLRHWLNDEVRVRDAINAEQAFNMARKGETVMITGTMGGVFDERMMIVAHPILYRNTIHGIVFMNSPIAEIEKNIADVVRLTLLCLILAAFIAFVLVYFSSRTIVRPIRMIRDVARVIAAGNFNKRLAVKSRDEVGQLAESFNNMAESLENQEISRRAFISNISHDLRSPLTSVKGYIQAMLDGTIAQEDRDKYLNVVLDETERVTKMANDLMYIGKFQNFEMDITPSAFDINELIRTTLITFERRINDKNISIEVSFADDKNIVEADFEKIQRVVYNLLDNAVKFSFDNGAITVTTSANHSKTPGLRAKEPGKIMVSIKDTGAGISEQEQKKVFDRFYKADISRGINKTGSGLGLAIVKELLHAHGEEITVTSEPGQGSEFTFQLPLYVK